MLWEDRIPLSADAHAMHDDQSPLQHALGDGEDFELLFAVSPDDGRRLVAEQPLSGLQVTVEPIGECVERGLWLRDAAGNRRPLEPPPVGTSRGGVRCVVPRRA